MTATVTQVPVIPAVVSLSDAVDEVTDLNWSRLDEDELLAVVRDIETARRRLEALDSAVIGEIEARNLPGKYVCRSTSLFLAGLLTLSPRESTARVRRARNLALRTTLTGEVLPPLLPATAAARAAGAITAQHADVIDRIAGRLRDRIPAAEWEQAEEFLIEQARHFDATTLTGIGRQLADTLDPDGTMAEEQQQQRRRHLSCSPLSDGSYRIAGTLDPETAALALTVLRSLAAPAPRRDSTAGEHPDGADHAASANRTNPCHNDDPAHDIAGASDVRHTQTTPCRLVERDERTPGQRMHDAFRSVLKLALRAGQLPASGGIPATVLITMTADQYKTRTGLATTSHGAKLRIDRALHLAEQTSITWLVHNSTGGTLDYGHTRRLATPAQTLALIARDRGCTFPGCTQPPEWTERHHVIPWHQGGATDLDNLTLLCDHHHDRIAASGWRITMRNGVPWYTPPTWLDPTQVPRRNVRP